LKEVAKQPVQCTIPDDNRERLIEGGYVREVMRTALTGRGLRRLATALGE